MSADSPLGCPPLTPYPVGESGRARFSVRLKFWIARAVGRTSILAFLAAGTARAEL